MKIIEGENYCIYLKRRSLVLETNQLIFRWDGLKMKVSQSSNLAF